MSYRPHPKTHRCVGIARRAEITWSLAVVEQPTSTTSGTVFCYSQLVKSANGRRKLLTAAVGVATISYVYACEDALQGGAETSGNLVAPPPQVGGSPQSAGGAGGGADEGGDGPGGAGGNGLPPTSGNLVAPPDVTVDVPLEPVNAGDDAGPGNPPDAGGKFDAGKPDAAD